MEMRIAIVGANGVGKTTLTELLAPELKLPLLPEIARELCHRMGYQNPSEIPDQQKFRLQVAEEQIAADMSVAAFVSDRSTIDCWVMWQRWQMCSAMTYTTEAYYDRCRAHADNYTQVIYVPPLFPPAEDEFRWTDADYIKQIDRAIRLTIHDWGLTERTYKITSITPQERVREVLAWLNA